MIIKTTFKDPKKLKELKATGLNGSEMRSNLHVPAHAKLETHIGYTTHLKHDIICYPIYSWLINFYTIDNGNNTICYR